MKKYRNFYLLAIAAIAMVFTSCKDDETTDKTPVISFKGGDGYVSSDVTLKTGEVFVIGVIATPNTSTNAKLTQLTVTRTFKNVPATVLDTTLDKLTSLNAEVNFTAATVEGEERIVFEVTDKDGQVATKAVVITTEAATTPLSAEKTFSLVYTGTSQSDGRNENKDLGIEYDKNVDGNTAAFATISGEFVMINAAKYSDIATKEALTTEFNAGTVVSKFQAKSDANFEDVYFISKTTKGIYLVHLTDLKFAAGNNKADFAFKE